MLFISNNKVENKFSKQESMQHEMSDGVHVADPTQVPVKASLKQ